MTIQVETTSIGIIYEEGDSVSAIENQRVKGSDEQGVVFTPSEFIRKILQMLMGM